MFLLPHLSLYVVRGASMAPLLRDGDFILAAPHRRAPGRGRIVVISMSGERWRVKRVVGLPGDRVALEDGLLFINGAHCPEPYLGGLPASPGAVNGSWDVGPRCLFVMGDNRAHSTDSRHMGPIAEDCVAGTVILRVWPVVSRGRL